ncbi:MAG: hypothetical protein QF464_11865, partial [Myxococcota bacterium]|nr:hypothetical protein [Myxococcota bacterium]
MLTFTAVALSLLVVTAGEPSTVLAPTAEPAVRKLLQLDKAIGKGLRVDASIQKDRVLVMAGQGDDNALAVMLVHASKAADGDTVIGELALRPKPGPAPKDLVKALTKRIKRGGGKLPWVTLEPDPEPKPPPAVAETGADVKAIH